MKSPLSYWMSLAGLFAAMVVLGLLPAAPRLAAAQVLDPCSLLAGQDRLVNGKIITQPPVGTVTEVGSFPANMALHPGGKFAVSCAMGFQGRLTSLSTETGAAVSSVQFNVSQQNFYYGLYYGLAAGPLQSDGSCTLYASQALNNTIAILRWAGDGTLTRTGKIRTNSVLSPLSAFAAGLALDASGRYLHVTNLNPLPDLTGANLKFNFWVPASVSIYDTQSRKSVGTYTFSNPPPVPCPSPSGSTPPTANFPMAIAVLANGSKAYVASERDGGAGTPNSMGAGLYVLNIATVHHIFTNPTKQLTLKKSIATGAHPDALLLDEPNHRLFVANG